MKQFPNKKRLSRPMCRKCANLIYYEKIPYCKKITPNIGNLGACKDFQERKNEEINEQMNIFSKIP